MKEIMKFHAGINEAIVNRIKSLGHGKDLASLYECALKPIEKIDQNQEMISWGSVYDSLMKIPVEEGDEILMLYRADQDSDFWANKGANEYLKYLQESNNHIKQKRIIIHNSTVKFRPFPDKWALEIAKLHNPGTLWQLDIRNAGSSNMLMNFMFGITIFPRLQCAIAPIPVLLSFSEYIENYGFPKISGIFPYNTYSNPELKAVLIIDPDKIKELISEFEKLNNCAENIDYERLYDLYLKDQKERTSYSSSAREELSNRLNQNLDKHNLWGMERFCNQIPIDDYDLDIHIIHNAIGKMANAKHIEPWDASDEEEFDRNFRDQAQLALAGDKDALKNVARIKFHK